jgi:hypothetical protein
MHPLGRHGNKNKRNKGTGPGYQWDTGQKQSGLHRKNEKGFCQFFSAYLNLNSKSKFKSNILSNSANFKYFTKK